MYHKYFRIRRGEKYVIDYIIIAIARPQAYLWIQNLIKGAWQANC